MALGLLWATLTAIVMSVLLGFLWYAMLFKTPWLRAMGWDTLSHEEKKQKQESGGPGYVASMLGTAVLTVLLWFLFQWAGDTPDYADWLKGVVLGFTGWFAFYLPATLTNHFFAQKPLALWAIDAGHFGTQAVLVGLVVGLFA